MCGEAVGGRQRLTSLVSAAGFERLELHYFHLQLVPHPFDRIAPAAATACVTLTDRFGSFHPRRCACG